MITFFITSADSGALVIDMVTSGGAENPPVWQRIFWAICAGVIAAVLLVAGGLEALQAAVITSALPFTVILIFICYGLFRALQAERRGVLADLSMAEPVSPEPERSWQQRLTSVVHHFGRSDIENFIVATARPALEAFSKEMQDSGFSPELAEDADCIHLTVPHGERGSFQYTIRSRPFLLPSFVWAETRKVRESEPKHFRAMAQTSEGDHPHDVTGFTRDQLINDLLNRYARFRHTRRLS